jgi:hypothetical protein
MHSLESFIALNILDDRPRLAEQFALFDEVRDRELWREGNHESFSAWLGTLGAQDDVEAYRTARGCFNLPATGEIESTDSRGLLGCLT